MKPEFPINSRTVEERRKRILIVDDHPIMREGLHKIITREPDLQVCGQTGDAFAAIQLVESTKPDLVLVDLTLDGKSGIELIKDLHVQHPQVALLALSIHDETLYAERVLRAGGRGYLMKQEDGNTLLQAIRRVLAGEIYLSKAMSARILKVFSNGRLAQAHAGVEELSDREFEVFRLIGEGLSSHEIGGRLHLSAKTIDAHRANIKGKLRIKSGSGLIAFSANWAAQEGGGEGPREQRTANMAGTG